MLKRHRLLIGLLVGAMLIGVMWSVWRVITPEPVRAYKRIQLGMTQGEVASAIGVPPRYPRMLETPGAGPVRESGVSGVSFFNVRKLGLTSEHWTWDGYCLMVVFEKGAVVGIYLFEINYPEPSLPRQLRRLLSRWP
jgi:hypothetical protein